MQQTAPDPVVLHELVESVRDTSGDSGEHAFA